jgi:hypothetical protein
LLDRVDLEAHRCEVFEVIGVAGEQGQVVGQRGCRDQQVDRTRAAGFAVTGTRGGVDQTVGAGCGSIERQRVQQCLDPLEPVLSPCPFLGVVGRVGAGGQLGEGDRRGRRLQRQRPDRDLLDGDDDGRVEQPPARPASMPRRSRPRLDRLVDDAVELVAEPLGVDVGGAREPFEEELMAHESSSGGTKLADGDAVAGHQEHLAAVEGTHDGPAVVAQFTLADGSRLPPPSPHQTQP